LWDKAKQDGSELGDAEGRKLVGIQGKPLQLYGSACVQVQLAAEKFPVEVMVAETPTVDMIIGRDFLQNQECTRDGKRQRCVTCEKLWTKASNLQGTAFISIPHPQCHTTRVHQGTTIQ